MLIRRKHDIILIVLLDERGGVLARELILSTTYLVYQRPNSDHKLNGLFVFFPKTVQHYRMMCILLICESWVIIAYNVGCGCQPYSKITTQLQCGNGASSIGQLIEKLEWLRVSI